jgi:hypothetical protein
LNNNSLKIFLGLFDWEFPKILHSRAFSLMNSQRNRTFSSIFEFKIGGEDIGKYKQKREFWV